MFARLNVLNIHNRMVILLDEIYTPFTDDAVQIKPDMDKDKISKINYLVTYIQGLRGGRKSLFLLFCVLYVYTNGLNLTKINGKTYKICKILYIYDYDINIQMGCL